MMAPPVTIPPRTRDTLQEAVRDIQQMAGLTPRPGSNDETPPALAIGVTSPNRGDGKTTLALALAGSLAEDLGVEVTLVDADFHTHSIELEYGLTGQDGFAELLEGSASVDDVSHRLAQTSLRVVPAGTALGRADRNVRSEHAARLVENMKETNRYVVFDLPATLSSTSAPVLARLCDGVIVVARAGQTTTLELEQTLARLKDSRVLGVVLNRWETSIPQWVQQSLGLRP